MLYSGATLSRTFSNLYFTISRTSRQANEILIPAYIIRSLVYAVTCTLQYLVLFLAITQGVRDTLSVLYSKPRSFFNVLCTKIYQRIFIKVWVCILLSSNKEQALHSPPSDSIGISSTPITVPSLLVITPTFPPFPPLTVRRHQLHNYHC